MPPLNLNSVSTLSACAVVVGIGEAIEGRAARAVADGKHVLAQRQDALAVASPCRSRCSTVSNLPSWSLSCTSSSGPRSREAMMSPASLKAIATSEPVELGRDDFLDLEAGQRREPAFRRPGVRRPARHEQQDQQVQ